MSDQPQTPDISPKDPTEPPEGVHVLVVINDTNEGRIYFGRLPSSAIISLGMLDWAKEKVMQGLFTEKPSKIVSPKIGIDPNKLKH